jgi:SAM-dependent methyltransferase
MRRIDPTNARLVGARRGLVQRPGPGPSTSSVRLHFGCASRPTIDPLPLTPAVLLSIEIGGGLTAQAVPGEPRRAGVVPFYGQDGLHVASYDDRLDAHPGALRGDVEFYERWADQLGGAVLDLGCGTGRVSWALADKGTHVVGLDRSPAMLRIAGTKAVGRPMARAPRFVLGDMRDFSLTERFSLVIVPFRSFQFLLDTDAQRSCLDSIHGHLRPGGRLILHVFDPSLEALVAGAPLPPAEDTTWSGGTLRAQVEQRSTEPFRQVLREQWLFQHLADDGEVLAEEREELKLRWTWRPEMRWLLQLSGFLPELEFSDFQGSPPTYGAEQLWIARKVER